MKSLDEVIKANECCNNDNRCEDCPYNGLGACVLKRETDALHYLKAYKKVQNKIEKIALGNITDTLDKLDNPVLSWDELTQMETKPVWIEIDQAGFKKGWFLICKIDDDFMWVVDARSHMHNFPRVCLNTGLWQAYRKERE